MFEDVQKHFLENPKLLSIQKDKFTIIIRKDSGLSNDRTEYHLDGKLHREFDLPAKIYLDGKWGWYKNGKLHREGDLPAFISNDGSEYWYKNGMLNRNGDMPSIMFSDGSRQWYLNNKLHRESGPAVIWVGGTQMWYKHGVRYYPEGQPS